MAVNVRTFISLQYPPIKRGTYSSVVNFVLEAFNTVGKVPRINSTKAHVSHSLIILHKYL